MTNPLTPYADPADTITPDEAADLIDEMDEAIRATLSDDEKDALRSYHKPYRMSERIVSDAALAHITGYSRITINKIRNGHTDASKPLRASLVMLRDRVVEDPELAKHVVLESVVPNEKTE